MKTHIEVQVCKGDRCRKNFSKYICERAQQEIARKMPPREDPPINVDQCLCQGRCEQGPTVKIVDHMKQESYILSNMDPIKIAQIISQIRSRQPLSVHKSLITPIPYVAETTAQEALH